jgi:hypothetical protein
MLGPLLMGKHTVRLIMSLIDKRQHSNIVDVESFGGADCNTKHYLVVLNVGERLSVSKQVVQEVYLERFNLKKQNDVEVKEGIRLKSEISLQLLENFDDDAMVLGYELKQHKSGFDEECSYN